MSKQLMFIKDPAEVMGVSKRRVNRGKPKVEEPQVLDCNSCGLYKSCKKPKIERFGKGGKKILIVGLCPGRSEDRYGIPFCGESGRVLKEMLDIIDINMDGDCIRTNIVRCSPGRDQRNRDIKPTNLQIRCCAQYLQKDIEETKPEMIICLGTEAIQAILKAGDAVSSIKGGATQLHGKVIPYHKLNCWVGCSFHPSFFVHRENDKNGINDKLILAYDLANITSVLGTKLPEIPSASTNVFVDNADEAVRVLKKYTNHGEVVAFDYETTRLKPHEDGADILSVSITDSEDYCHFIPISATDGFIRKRVMSDEDRSRILSALRDFVAGPTPKTCQNYYMEEMWSRKFLGVGINNFVHDTMVSYHVVNCSNKGCTSLGFQAMEMKGHEYKIDRSKIQETPIKELADYTCYDSRHTKAAYNIQTRILKHNPRMKEFNDLFTRSLRTLANISERGIRIDSGKMEEIEAEYKENMGRCINEIRSKDGVKKLERKNGKEFNPNSPPQWEELIYDIYGVKKTKKRTTPTGRGSTDGDVLKEINNTTDNEGVKEILDSLFRYRDGEDVLKKINEYRKLIHQDGKIHPTFGLHTADTFRSSAVGPNSQNAYKHDHNKRKFRRVIVPEPGQIMLEADYKAHEARVIGMASGDVELIRQTIEKIDIHKKWASRIFGISIDQVTADQKYSGKNQFVFPSVYGADAYAIAGYFGMKYPVEKFEKLQAELWEEFKGVRRWQMDTIKFYCEHGYIEGLSGFRCKGPLTIYQIYNWPIQGVAFHLLLDALNRIDDYLVSHNFKTTIINEIHDSILFSAEPSEVDDVMEITTRIMKSQRFDWQTVPLDVSWEMGENWYDMLEV